MFSLLENTTSNLLKWRVMELSERPSNYAWGEEAVDSTGNVAYVLYYDNVKNMQILEDKTYGIKYNLSITGKHKGYVLAFKLNNLRKKIK